MTEGFSAGARVLHVDPHQDLLTKYTPEEREMIGTFVESRVSPYLNHGLELSERPLAILVGGMLGAGKSHMGHVLAKESYPFCKADVNDDCLCELKGYIDDYLSKGFQAAYNKWREASIFIAQKIIETMTAANCSFINVSTATGAHVPGQIDDLLQRGYQVVIKGCATTPEISRENIKAENRFRYLPSRPAASFELPEEHLEKNKEWSARAIYFKQLALENPLVLFEQYVLRRGPEGHFEHVLAFKVENGVFVEVDHGACREFDKICLEVNHGPYRTPLTPSVPRVA
ncbi:MAG: zeta toxin family protein [Alphaproteobacteria bacterium]|nr:zeta toxin family protein [Alphaproteobacteria bacterium]